MRDHTSDGGHGGPAHDTSRGYAPEGHAAPGGLALAANGLRFEPSRTRFEAGTAADWTFRVVDDEARVVTDFDDAHGERSHLIVVRRDLTRFQHLHPELDSDGTWHVEGFELPDAGVYRTFVDLVVAGRPTTLGFDLFASGAGDIEPRPTDSRVAVADGYEVELAPSDIGVGDLAQLTFEVRSDGEPVPNLDEYLGSLGHLVALREGDLAYLHAHPVETAPDGGRVEFGVRFPTVGRYRLFLQAKPEGNLVTASFDVRIR